MIDYLKATQAAIMDILGTAYNVHVQASGDNACVDLRDPYNLRVYLPEVPNGVLNRYQADTFTGYWLHESLHGKYTDGQCVIDAQIEGVADWFNSLEDCRIELLAHKENIAANLLDCLARVRNHRFQTYSNQDMQTMLTDDMIQHE